MIKRIIYRNPAPRALPGSSVLQTIKNRALILEGNREQCLSGLLEDFYYKMHSEFEAKTKQI